MTPKDFRDFVERIAADNGFPRERIILAGDHLGPNPWKNLPAEEAMEKAEVMISSFAAAGFTKLHLDCSMGCKGEPVALKDEETASRAARLAAAAESALSGGDTPKPVYVIGTEVPIPGGAMHALDELQLTTPEDARRTVRIHEQAFAQAGQSDAFSRVIAVVVQPGVEFGSHNVIDYNSGKAQALSATLKEMPGLVFEAHSTDYQTCPNLSDLVQDGFAILKVGPGLTFVLREAFYGLDAIAEELFPGVREETLRATMERIMLAAPENWAKYYEGSEAELALQRHFSYSDRIRYYWPQPEADAAVHRLFEVLGDTELPETLIGQYLGARYEAVRNGTLASDARSLALASVDGLMQDYITACQG
jgi:D-tagatose-1,6-bisphosphate aldolase subunit GatZ/KbaZ